jgi:hypothetical protein
MFFRKLIVFIMFTYVSIFAQVNSQIEAYRHEPYGDIQNRREGLMDGNQIRTLFYNNGEVGQWPFSPSGEWPRGSGHNYLDGVAVLIATELHTQGGIIHTLETSYREWMDRDPVTGLIWGMEPVAGYFNPASTSPAISTDEKTWPSVWPSALPNITPEWNGYWYGYFGRGVKNADFETFFVMDDSKDGEFARPPYNYYPVQEDSNRHGMGIRVEVRGFQWSHVLAEDIIFWHYDIVNLSDSNYEKTYFGFYTDTGVGGAGDNQDDCASYDTKLDLAYAFDDDGFGSPGHWKTGYYGYAYLESPGNPYDGIDNDEDGMVDERRDDGIDNDGDWIPFSDLNGNGVWDPDENEPVNNDVGQDGVGPLDPQYLGPDQGEGDGIPTEGEPNFDKTDKDESDQIGLTALSIYRLGDGGTGGGWPKDDESMWLKMASATFDTSLQRANISMVFASGAFPLKLNARNRFSMALVFGDNLDDMVFNKETVQQIYNANYNFSKPPLKPHLTAVPGDKKIYLYWDNVAENSRDPFLGYENNDPAQGYKKDFEGYLVYRSREPEFNDIKIITDSHGNPKFWKPIAQFDLIDSIKGPDPIGINGAHFYRGGDTGLQHSFIDTDVENGVKYYYALVSYDMGDPNFGTAGLVPSECTKIITEDFSGNLKFVDYNCAVVTPNAPAAGYQPAEIDGDVTQVSEGIGTGHLNVTVLNENEVKQGAQYDVVFSATGDVPSYQTSSLQLQRTLNGVVDTIFQSIPSDEFGNNSFTEPFDGLVFSVVNDTSITIDHDKTGWLVGESNLTMAVTPDSTSPAISVAWPADYMIKFYDTNVYETPNFHIQANFLVFNETTGDTSDAEIWDNDGSGDLSMGDDIVIIEYVGTQFKLTWRIAYHAPGTPNVRPMEPVAGDEFFIKTRKPFYQGDKFSFSTKASNIDKDLAKSQLDKINVVPNPYIGAASWERRNLNQTGRGERKIEFIHLPADCTIRIYNVSGDLVKTLHKDFSATDGSIFWNLITEDGMEIAPGLYIYHVDAPGVGEHIGKFAVIK